MSAEYPEFLCSSCGEWFPEPVWECPKCSHHSHAGAPRECKYCYSASRRGRTGRIAEYRWAEIVRQFERVGR